MCITTARLIQTFFIFEKEFGRWRFFILFIITATISWYTGLLLIGYWIYIALPRTDFEQRYYDNTLDQATNSEIITYSLKYTLEYAFAGWLLHIGEAIIMRRHKPLNSIWIGWIVSHLITWPIAVFVGVYIILNMDPSNFIPSLFNAKSYVIWQSNPAFYLMTAIQGFVLGIGEFILIRFFTRAAPASMIAWLHTCCFLYWILISVLGWVLQLPAGVVVFFFNFMIYPDWCHCCCNDCPGLLRIQSSLVPNFNPSAIPLEIHEVDKKKKEELDKKNEKYEAPEQPIDLINNENNTNNKDPTNNNTNTTDNKNDNTSNSASDNKSNNSHTHSKASNPIDLGPDEYVSKLSSEEIIAKYQRIHQIMKELSLNRNDVHSKPPNIFAIRANIKEEIDKKTRHEEEEKNKEDPNDILDSKKNKQLADTFVSTVAQISKNNSQAKLKKAKSTKEIAEELTEETRKAFDAVTKDHALSKAAFKGLQSLIKNEYAQDEIQHVHTYDQNWSPEQDLFTLTDQASNSTIAKPKPRFNNVTYYERWPDKNIWRNVQPYSIEDVREFMEEAAKHKRSIRAAGTLYAFNNITFTKGLLVDMNAHLFNPNLCEQLDVCSKLLNEDGLKIHNRRHLIISQAGTSVEMIHDVTWPKSKRRSLVDEKNRPYRLLRCMPGFHQLAIGGLISVGAEGKGRLHPKSTCVAMQNQVLSFHMLTFDKDGKIRECQIERTKGIHDPVKWNEFFKGSVELIQDDEIFNGTISSAGSCGIIYSYTLWLTDAFNVKQYRFVANWNNYKKYHAELVECLELGLIHHLELYLSPYNAGLFGDGDQPCAVSLSFETNEPRAKIIDESNAGASYGPQDSAYYAGAVLVWLSHHLPNALGWGLYVALLLDSHEPVVMDALSSQILGAPSCVPVQVSGMIVKFEHSISAMDRWSKLFQVTNHMGQYKYYCTSPVGVTFCGSPGDGFIAMGSQRRTSWLELPFLDYTRKNPRLGATKRIATSIRAFYTALMEHPYHGRFHLAFNNYNMLKRNIWQDPNYYPEFNTWLKVYRQFNCLKLFSNPFTVNTEIDLLAFPDDTSVHPFVSTEFTENTSTQEKHDADEHEDDDDDDNDDAVNNDDNKNDDNKNDYNEVNTTNKNLNSTAKYQNDANIAEDILGAGINSKSNVQVNANANVAVNVNGNTDGNFVINMN